ncbi:hypothetical protein CLF_113302 [Clonorchis sinensis]|uniref:Uncharacterized protein n=1 Tax=Clonorchis sinensis TaxID=79923 RepID=G7YY47_CLOSI|nr:hypothetical protein CLF_113302 [Clonorchis sinensis]
MTTGTIQSYLDEPSRKDLREAPSSVNCLEHYHRTTTGTVVMHSHPMDPIEVDLEHDRQILEPEQLDISCHCLFNDKSPFQNHLKTYIDQKKLPETRKRNNPFKRHDME